MKNGCSKEYDSKDWSTLTSLTNKKISEKEAPSWLLKFSKPSGFNLESDLSILLGLIEIKAYLKYPAEFNAALYGIFVTNPILYYELIFKYPKLKEIKAPPSKSCVTVKEQEKIKEALLENFNNRLLFNQSMKKVDLETLLFPLKHYLTNEEKKHAAVQVAEKVVSLKGNDRKLKDIFTSKIYKFALNKAENLLGLPFHDLTDLTVARDMNSATLYQLGVDSFPQGDETVGGFYVANIEKLQIKDFTHGKTVKNFKWNYNNKNYEASVTFEKENLGNNVVPENKAPNYTEMWKDGTFRGLIILGSNMGSETTADVVRDYIEYYSKEGFSFGKPSEQADLINYLKMRILGSEPIHYFIKEAHSDGDEKNLFRINKNGKVLRGTKKVDDKNEVIDIVYPSEANSANELVSNTDFGEWIREREKKGQPELVYLNSSCWSTTKAIYEITSARSSKLINIPTTTMMTVFTNDEANVMRSAVDGIRKKKSYEEIRTNMIKDEEYKKKEGNIMIFPDEPAYQENVRELVNNSVSIDTKIFVEKDKGIKVPYSIENER